MSWSLHIDIPQSKFKAGDIVSGSVCLVSQHTKGQEVDVGFIAIEFTGQSTTSKHWPRIPDTIRLFSFKKTLLTGPRRLHAPYGQVESMARNEWPFSFTLPLSCSLPQRDSMASSPYFNPDPNQPLPISFVDENVQGGSCSIMYELQATLLSPLKNGYYTNEGCTEKVEIFVHRPRSIAQPSFSFNDKISTFTHRSLLLLPREERELAHRPFTIKERLKLKPPSTEHSPKAVFTIKVQTPSAAVIGQPLPLMLHVDYDAHASSVPPPIFHLRRVSIYLCEESSIWGLKRAGELESTRWTKEITLQEKEFVTRRPRVEEHLDLRKVMDTMIPRNVTPNFKTFNIARNYSLKVFARVECAGKEHLVFGDYKHCTLSAEDHDSQAAVYNEPAPIVGEEENDPPPPYELVTQEAVPEYSIQAHHTGQNQNAVLGTTGYSTAAVSEFAAVAPSAGDT